MFGITHKHKPIRDNTITPNKMVCSDPKCNALLGNAPVTVEQIKEELYEDNKPVEPEEYYSPKASERLKQVLPVNIPKPQPGKPEKIELSRLQIYELAIKKFGVPLQINQSIQESAELIQELTNTLRGETNAEEVAEEMADVEIMLAQLKIIYGNRELVKSFKESKLQRLSEMLTAKPEEQESDAEDE